VFADREGRDPHLAAAEFVVRVAIPSWEFPPVFSTGRVEGERVEGEVLQCCDEISIVSR
jgi:hypothetical protein